MVFPIVLHNRLLIIYGEEWVNGFVAYCTLCDVVVICVVLFTQQMEIWQCNIFSGEGSVMCEWLACVSLSSVQVWSSRCGVYGTSWRECGGYTGALPAKPGTLLNLLVPPSSFSWHKVWISFPVFLEINESLCGFGRGWEVISRSCT